MLNRSRATLLLAGAATLATAFAAPAMAQSWVNKPVNARYVAGDFHNHTTCIDGTVSVQWLLDKSLNTWGLDWFVHANHGGAGTRDCRFMDPEFDGSVSGEGKFWVDTMGQTVQNITINTLKGDAVTGTDNGVARAAMWRWQSMQEIDYPIIQQRSKAWKKVAIEGVEQNVPGHEHADTTIIGNQFATTGGNADAIAEYEYQFDRNDGDTSGGAGQWTTLTDKTGPGNIGLLGHAKSVAGVTWMQANYPTTGYMIPTHVERQGVFNATGNKGFNVEQFRDYNNAGPTVAFGFDGPGHQATGGRGSYGGGAVGGGTFGGRGVYVAKIGGVWDAMLGEGRNFFYYGSSDFHGRGIFGPSDRASTGDFYPGEYERNYVFSTQTGPLRARSVIDAMRSGNSFNVFGDLITSAFSYKACAMPSNTCATMGETLIVQPGDTVTVTMTTHTPATNNSPYSFPNPILSTVGITQPLNTPVLDHVDFITGNVTGVIAPTDANYTNGTNTSAKIAKTFSKATWKPIAGGASVTFNLKNINAPMYIRARGTNLPAGIANVTDSLGNPLSDTLMNNVTCTDAACPAHLPVNGSGQKIVDVDVEAWSSLWFYANPIFIRPVSTGKLAVEKAADQLAVLVAAGK